MNDRKAVSRIIFGMVAGGILVAISVILFLRISGKLVFSGESNAVGSASCSESITTVSEKSIEETLPENCVECSVLEYFEERTGRFYVEYVIKNISECALDLSVECVFKNEDGVMVDTCKDQRNGICPGGNCILEVYTEQKCSNYEWSASYRSSASYLEDAQFAFERENSINDGQLCMSLRNVSEKDTLGALVKYILITDENEVLARGYMYFKKSIPGQIVTSNSYVPGSENATRIITGIECYYER